MQMDPHRKAGPSTWPTCPILRGSNTLSKSGRKLHLKNRKCSFENRSSFFPQIIRVGHLILFNSFCERRLFIVAFSNIFLTPGRLLLSLINQPIKYLKPNGTFNPNILSTNSDASVIVSILNNLCTLSNSLSVCGAPAGDNKTKPHTKFRFWDATRLDINPPVLIFAILTRCYIFSGGRRKQKIC